MKQNGFFCIYIGTIVCLPNLDIGNLPHSIGIDTQYLDRSVYPNCVDPANSVDPDQTAPRGAV